MHFNSQPFKVFGHFQPITREYFGIHPRENNTQFLAGICNLELEFKKIPPGIPEFHIVLTTVKMQFIDITACSFWVINPSNRQKQRIPCFHFGPPKCSIKVYAAVYTFCRRCWRTLALHQVNSQITWDVLHKVSEEAMPLVSFHVKPLQCNLEHRYKTLTSASQTNTAVKRSAVSVWDFALVSEVIPQTSSPWLCVRAHPRLQSSSLTVFMELCFVVSVVSRLSLRPCKEAHRGAAQPHCAPTTIPELTHLSSSSMSELQIYVRDPAGLQEDWVSRSGCVLWLKTVV